MNSSGVLPGASVSTRPTGKPEVGFPSILRSSRVTLCVFPVLLVKVTTIRYPWSVSVLLPGSLQPDPEPSMVTGGVLPEPAKAGAAAAVAITGTAQTPVRTTARLLG